MSSEGKICTRCKKLKPSTEFRRRYQTGRQEKLNSWCKQCWLDSTNSYRRNNKAFRARQASVTRASRLKRKYNLSPSEYKEMLRLQEGKCAICKQPETRTIRGKIKHMAVDHDHETGQVRGLLCTDCNQGLGHFKDNPELLRAAIAYLHQPNQQGTE